MLKYLRAEEAAEAETAAKKPDVIEEPVRVQLKREGLELKLDVVAPIDDDRVWIPIAKSEEDDEEDEDEDSSITAESRLVVKDENDMDTVRSVDKKTEKAKLVLNSTSYLNFMLSDSAEHKNQQSLQEMQEAADMAENKPGDECTDIYKKEAVNLESIKTIEGQDEEAYEDEYVETDTVYMDDDMNIVSSNFKFLNPKMCDNLIDNSKQLTSEEQFHQAFILNVSTRKINIIIFFWV
jgi:hypothetical protein